jgi:hypothetical protein
MNRNIANSILAMPAVAVDIPVNPNKPAIIEIIKKNKAHFNISLPPLLANFNYSRCFYFFTYQYAD